MFNVDNSISDRNRSIQRALLLAGFVLGCISIAFVAAAFLPFESIRIRLDAHAGDGDAEAFTRAVHHRFRTAMGVAGLTMFMLTFVLLRAQKPRYLSSTVAGLKRLLIDTRKLFQISASQLGQNIIVVVLILVFTAAVRLPWLSQPLRYDESHTFNNYSQLALPLIVARYDEPNNHVLHSVAVAVSTRLFGTAPAAIRFPAFIAGVVTPVAVFLLTRTFATGIAASVAAVLCATLPVSIFYSVNARGYTIAGLFTVTAMMLTVRLWKHQDFCASLILTLTLSAAMWVVPTMVYLAVPLLAVLGFRASRSTSESLSAVMWLALTLGTGILTAIMYLPIMLAYGPRHLSKFGSSGSAQSFQILRSWRPAGSLAEWMTQGVPVWCSFALGIMLAAGFYTLLRQRFLQSSWPGFVAIAVVLFVQNVIPPDRTWYFTIPLLCAVAGVGLTTLVQTIRRPAVEPLIAAGACLVLCGSILFHSSRTSAISQSPETGYFPEGRSVATFLSQHVNPGQPVVAVTPASAVLVYYAADANLALEHFRVPGQGETNDSSAMVVVDQRSGQSVQQVLDELQLGGLFSAEESSLLESIGSAGVYQVSGIR